MPDKETNSEQAPPPSKRRILVVDDETAIRDVFLHLISFGLPDCRVDVAVNGAEAVEAFRTVRYPVIVMDIKMPVMDGEAAFREIQKICEVENWKMPAVIFCSGYAPPSAVQDIVENSQIHCILMKPVRNWQLVKEIEARLPPA